MGGFLGALAGGAVGAALKRTDAAPAGDGDATRTNVTPQDIAEGAAVLCSETGRFITGCQLPYAFN